MSSTHNTHTQQLLPLLRADLELSVAPSEESGKPVWMLHDPVHSTFTSIDWIQFEIIKRLDKPQTFEELITRITNETTIREDRAEITAFLNDLIQHGLTTQTLYKSSSHLETEAQRQKVSPLKWLMFHYLYFRLPLIHPDKFLENTLGVFKLITSKAFLFIYIIISITGLYFLSQRFDEYIHTFTNFLNPKGIFIYGISIAVLKTLHEFSHAYTAKYYGNRVPTIGLAFIILWPIPFCDVTDSWRMNSRSKRLKISASGIITELIIAGIALFIWGISNNSSLKSITFVLSSLSILSTLLVNINPLMRFDGYYLFSDLTGIDNLQLRAFTMTRWFYRKFLLGIDIGCPEPELSLQRKTFMMAYSISTWIYRLFLYTGIALVVYYTFPKVIGIILFGIEIITFLLKPLYKEFSTNYKLLHSRRINIHFAIFMILMLSVLTWLSLPLSRFTSIPAITATDEEQIIYSPVSGIIYEQFINRDSKVSSGEKLISINSNELEAEIALAQLAINQLARDLRQISSKPKLKGLTPQLRETYLQAKARLRSLNKKLQHSIIYSEIDGTVTNFKNTLRSGVAVFKGEELGKILNLRTVKLQIYATSEEISYLKIGDELEFIPSYSNYQNTKYRVRITNINPTREVYLKHPELAAVNGGTIDVIPDKEGALKIIKPFFEVECHFTEKNINLRFDQPGRVTFWSRPRSYMKDLFNHIYKVLIRESGL